MLLFDINHDNAVDLIEFAIGTGVFDPNSPNNLQSTNTFVLEKDNSISKSTDNIHKNSTYK